MNDTTKNIEFMERLKKHPILQARLESILNLAENTDGNIITASEAEQRTIFDLRQLGNEILHDWANNRINVSVAQLKKEESEIEGNGKKKLRWHTSFGDIEVQDPLFRRPGKQFRPFSYSAGIQNRGCSLPLQRIVVDFGADHAFGRVPEKLQEHYGIEISVSTIRMLTESHANQMYEQQKEAKTIPEDVGCQIQIGEIDGSMIPIVTIDENSQDKRKNKQLAWKKARLSIAHELGSVTPKYGAVFQGSVDDAGQSLLNSAILAGFGQQTYLHAVGDGATWIANQIADKFAAQGSYLLDFYHVCEYLAEAATSCAANDENWIETQKDYLKNNKYEIVIANLKSHLEADKVEKSKAPVRACYRYLSNRTEQLDYKTAIENGLPIGSGEVESAHRYVIQERLKLSGAWWEASNADSMLALRVMRANNQWDEYWEENKAA
jgi:hypothetical protein